MSLAYNSKSPIFVFKLEFLYLLQCMFIVCICQWSIRIADMTCESMVNVGYAQNLSKAIITNSSKTYLLIEDVHIWCVNYKEYYISPI